MSLNLWAYKILKTKGIGGYGHVHKAVNRFTGQIVAIKELRNPTSDNRRRFSREGDMLTIYKDSPYFPDIYQSVLDGAQPFLVMEYSSKVHSNSTSARSQIGNMVHGGRLISLTRSIRWKCVKTYTAI